MALRPEIKYGGNRVYYSPAMDYIQLPNRHTFQSAEEFYSTMFHELTHATGHIYSKEELVAEMGASFLCGFTGIETRTIVNSAAYIQGWLKELRNDKKLLVLAAAQAQKASDFILNRIGGELEVIEDIAA